MITQEFADKWIASHRAVGGERIWIVNDVGRCCLLGSAFHADTGRLPHVDNMMDEEFIYSGDVFIKHLTDGLGLMSSSVRKRLATKTYDANDGFDHGGLDYPRSIVEDGVDYIQGLVL